MGLEAVKEEILSSAKEQANSLLAEARKEANRIMKEADKAIEAVKDKSEAETKKAIDMVKRQEIASADLDNKKKALGAKKEVIESVFEEAKSRLEKLDEKKREIYIKKLLDKVKREIEVNRIYCNKKDVKFIKGLDVKSIEAVGGLIAESREGSVRVDYSFGAMLEGLKEKELQNIDKILFE